MTFRRIEPEADLIRAAYSLKVASSNEFDTFVAALEAHAQRSLEACLECIPDSLQYNQARAREAADLAELLKNLGKHETNLRNLLKDKQNAPQTRTR